MHEQRIQRIVSKYIGKEITVDEFRQQFAVLYFAARKTPDHAGARVCNEMIGPMAEYGRGVGGEELLRKRLRRFAAGESQAPKRRLRPR
jgi:hypothetical protein